MRAAVHGQAISVVVIIGIIVTSEGIAEVETSGVAVVVVVVVVIVVTLSGGCL